MTAVHDITPQVFPTELPADVIPFGDVRLPVRFWQKIQISPTGCWLWTAAIKTKGYASFYDRETERNRRGHCFAYERAVGTVPEGLELDHLCRTRHCVNPAHLEPVTTAENAARGVVSLLPPWLAATPRSHCRHGHEMTAENAREYLHPRGSLQRVCRECERIHDRKRRAKRRHENEQRPAVETPDAA